MPSAKHPGSEVAEWLEGRNSKRGDKMRHFPTRMSQELSKWLFYMDYNLLINGVYWGYNPLTNHLLTSWDIQALLTTNSYSFSHNHGSVENGYVWKVTTEEPIFDFHDYGRKCKAPENRPFVPKKEISS